MRNVVYSAILAAALGGSATSTAAQTIQAAAPAGPQLYKGLTMKAEQHCPRFPGQGVTFTVESLNQSGTAGDVFVQVDCWNNLAIVREGNYRGTIVLEGGSVTIRFYSIRSINTGANLFGGTWQTDASGRPTLVFGKSELRAEKKAYTNELVFH